MKIGGFELQEPEPALGESHAISMLSPWLDAGNVGTLTLTRLEQSMGAQEVARLTIPGDYFDFTRYRPTTTQVEGRRVLNVPNAVISYARGDGNPDLILCRVLEPHASAEKYIASLVEVLTTLKVKRYCRIGAMYDAVPHTRPILISGTLNGKPLVDPEGEVVTRPRRRSYRGPTTILNLLNEQLEQQGIESMTLMARIPQYLQLEDDYSGVGRMLEVLAGHYHLPFEFPEVEKGRRQYAQVEGELERNRSARDLVQRLETEYDANNGGTPKEEETPLSPEVERFLRDLSGRMENPNE
jgi:hypothetical protein